MDIIPKRMIRFSERTEKVSFFMGLPFIFIGVLGIFMAIFKSWPLQFLPFPIFWTLIASFISYREYKFTFTNNRDYLYEIENLNDKGSFDEKLKRLEMLKEEGLINNEEYNEKRNEIMSEKW